MTMMLQRDMYYEEITVEKAVYLSLLQNLHVSFNKKVQNENKGKIMSLS